MLLTKGTREEAITTLINIWLKDDRVVCIRCGFSGNDHDLSYCEPHTPIWGTNKDMLRIHCQELKILRETRKNKFASNSDKSIRWSMSIPTALMSYLKSSFSQMYHGEQLFNKVYDENWFMKHFGKYFSVPEEM